MWRITQIFKKYYLHALVFGLILFIQYPLIVSDPILTYDDQVLVTPLFSGLYPWRFSYYQAIFHSGIWDVQPVRDLSYSLDYFLNYFFNLKTFHLQNLLIWIGICYLFNRILLQLKIRFNLRISILILCLFYPIFWISVSWISARKHLLSAFFILISTLKVIESKTKNENLSFLNQSKIALAYLAACFSQPINIFWPLFFIYSFKNELKKYRILILSILGTGLITGIINLYYYSKIYPLILNIPKFAASSDEHFSLKILGFSRSLFQIFIPFWATPTPYYQGSPQNILGIFFLTLTIWSLIKTRDSLIRSFLIFSLLPLVVIFTQSTNIFGSDTYLIIPGFGFFIIISLFLNKKKIISNKTFSIIFFPYLVSCIYSCRVISLSNLNVKDLFYRAYQIEPTPFNLRTLLRETFKAKDYKNSKTYAMQLIQWDPYGPFNDNLFSSIVFSLPNIKDEEKIKILKNTLTTHKDLSWTTYNLAAIYAKNGYFQKSFELLNNLQTNDFYDFNEYLTEVMIDYLYFCKHSKNNCTHVLNSIETLRLNKNWNEKKFEKRIKELAI
jgi:hypothetical protein